MVQFCQDREKDRELKGLDNLLGAVFQRSQFSPGSIYAEASNPTLLRAAIKDLPGVGQNPKVTQVPPHEVPSLFNLGQSRVQPGNWVRVRGRGLYRNDLGYVSAIDGGSDMATILLVPRIFGMALGPRIISTTDRNEKQKNADKVRPPPQPFNPKLHPVSFEELDNMRVKYKKGIFSGGALEKKVRRKFLYAASPTMRELVQFHEARAIEASVMMAAMADCAAASLKVGDRVRIVSGEQKDSIGKIDNVVGDIATILLADIPLSLDVPLASIRLHLRRSDYVRVTVGKYEGKKGWVMEVAHQDVGDIVTFTDDKIALLRADPDFEAIYAEAAAKYLTPEEVSYRHSVVDLANYFIQFTVSSYEVEIFEPDIEYTFFPQSIVSQDPSQQPSPPFHSGITSYLSHVGTRVLIVGASPWSGHRGITCGAVKFDNSGVWSYKVLLDGKRDVVEISTGCLKVQ